MHACPASTILNDTNPGSAVSGVPPRAAVARPAFAPDLATAAVPRYTSYPTAAEIRGDLGIGSQALALIAVTPDTPVSLYVHIPYCHSICWYCGCNTGAVGRQSRLSAYRDALIAEIATVAGLMRGRVTSVHFGGGSPNALPPADLVAIGTAVWRAFHVAPDAEWAMEIDPRAFTPEHAAAMAAIGITRASLGAQTFAAHVQEAIGRIQPLATVAKAARDLRGAGILRHNLDLMYGLPRQTLDDIDATIDDALTLAPARIAMFGYAHMPQLLPRQRRIDSTALPDAEARFRQSELAYQRLTGAGYRPVGFDHFARPGDGLAIAADTNALRRNFQGFTDDAATTLVGLGASAISQFGTLMVQNEKHVGRYREAAAAGALTATKGVRRGPSDRLRGAIIEAVLCRDEVDVAAICDAFGQAPSELAEALPAIDELARGGLLDRQGWQLSIFDQARPYRRLIAAAFDQYRQPIAGRFSPAI